MKIRTSITCSRSGHYTVTITTADKTRLLFKENLISNIANARDIAAQAKEEIENKEIIVEQVAAPTQVEEAQVSILASELMADGYTFCKSPDDYTVYRVKKAGDETIGIGPCEGESVLCLDGTFPSVSLDDENVTYIPAPVPPMCDHTLVKCLHCGEEGKPGKFLQRGKRTMTPAKAAALARATEGRKAAAAKRREEV